MWAWESVGLALSRQSRTLYVQVAQLPRSVALTAHTLRCCDSRLADGGNGDDDGTALCIVASFMNHASEGEATTSRFFLGPLLFVVARRCLRRGAELTTSYFLDKHAEQQRHMWDIP